MLVRYWGTRTLHIIAVLQLVVYFEIEQNYTSPGKEPGRCGALSRLLFGDILRD